MGIINDVDAEIKVSRCNGKIREHLLSLITQLSREGVRRIVVRLEGARFEECIDYLREPLQAVLAQSILVVDSSYELNVHGRKLEARG
jgi:uncharacterized radical SAM superfamily Fe-S cluster-containing enzyme